ncbi:HTTM domain-containing protein [Actinoplanes utahensis]|uniref:HTTM domain-containing protein n=1 Tax=Actinoplanes utahensis TaxID=1869 RepID=UPI000A04656D|nr:HTTM domain-containing protein [Actinoplanes utahensis]GIF27676.1 hypothetical protein Aut01nite_06620 [Actinoplanes utahensis]
MAIDQSHRPVREPDATETPPRGTVKRQWRNRSAEAYRLLTERPLSLYAAAFLRIGYGLLFLVLLVREFPYRHQIWGPEAPWTPAMALETSGLAERFRLLTLSDSRLYFEAVYVVAFVLAVLFMLGWRTRAVSIVFAIVVGSFHARNLPISNAGDKLLYLMVVYLAFTACGRRWSLDARRLRRRPVRNRGDESRPATEDPRSIRAQVRVLRRFTVTVLHNCAMLVMMAQMCIVYGAAGLYKVQGEAWSDGTALAYSLDLQSFQVWPALSQFVDSQPLVIAVATYLTVLAQVAFPFSLFSKLKYVVLAILCGMHLGIGVLMGLPFFSSVMILADAVFLPDRFFRSLPRIWHRVRHPRRRGAGAPALNMS